jgi:tetratricopeptide (TPR) repeat protein
MERALRPRITGALLAGLLAAAGAGCKGRSEFRRGETCYQAGEFRQAYYHFWRAYRQSPGAAHLASLRQAGRRVARIERERGLEAEALGDLENALAAYALALEYDPAWTDIEADYARSWGALREWLALASDLDGARSPEGAPWDELDALLRAAHHPAFTEARRVEIAAAARKASRSATGPLIAAAQARPWPPAPEAVLVLEAGLLSAIDEMELRLRAEEDGWFAGEAREREVASWEAVREGLADGLAAARAALAAVEPAADAIRLHDRGRALERQGKLAEALRAYDRALAGCAGFDAAREARRAAVARLGAECHAAALLAVERQDWAGALERLDLLLGFDPGHAPAQSLREVARREVAALHLAEARRHEDAGLPGNAVVRCYLALHSTPDEPSVRNAIRKLEASLLARVERRWKVTLGAMDADERRVRRDLWGVGDEALSRLERAVVERTESLLLQGGREPAAGDRGSSRTSFRGERAGAIPLVIEDFDFFYPRGERSRGIETARYVESMRLVPNPARSAAAARAARAEAELGEALARERAAPVHKQAAAAKRTRLARGRAAEAVASVDWIAESTLATAWAEVSYATERVDVRSELACRYSLLGESRWVTARLGLADRIVEGDPDRSVPADPEDLPSRAETLRVLSERLAEALALDAAQVFAARDVRRYEEALALIASRSFDQAVENLVAFLYARRRRGGAGGDPLAAEAAGKLLGLTGCDLPRGWRLIEGR